MFQFWIAWCDTIISIPIFGNFSQLNLYKKNYLIFVTRTKMTFDNLHSILKILQPLKKKILLFTPVHGVFSSWRKHVTQIEKKVFFFATKKNLFFFVSCDFDGFRGKALQSSGGRVLCILVVKCCFAVSLSRFISREWGNMINQLNVNPAIDNFMHEFSCLL